MSAYRQLISLRDTLAALRTGQLSLLNTGSTSIYASIRWNGTETLLVVANLAGTPVSDYGLTLTSAEPQLQKGILAGMALFGSGPVASLQVGPDGSFTAYKPLATIPAYGMYVIQLTPR